MECLNKGTNFVALCYWTSLNLCLLIWEGSSQTPSQASYKDQEFLLSAFYLLLPLHSILKYMKQP